MKYINRLLLVGLLFFSCILEAQVAVNSVLKPSDLAMHRNQMYLHDSQVILTNGRGFASPRQFSLTGVTSVHFMPISWGNYDFWLNIKDRVTGTVIQDNTPELFRNGPDPLGCNFRPGAPMLLVPQDQVWEPNNYYREAVFHKFIKDRWISFKMESWTSVSAVKDEIFLKIKVKNNNYEMLDVLIQPHQINKQFDHEDNSFIAIYGDYKAVVSSDLTPLNDGFELKLQPGEEKICCFAIQLTTKDNEIDLQQKDILNRIDNAYNRTCERLALTSSLLPVVKSKNQDLEELYKRFLITVNECKYERDDFAVNPFWASGTWMISMIWDQCFAEEVLALLSPDGVKESIKLCLRTGQAKTSYIDYTGKSMGYQLYIQDPFALQTMIDAYITYTGDWTILDEKVDDKTVYEWMKLWTNKLHDEFASKDGFIDVGYNTEFLIEIRTDSYNHVVPVVNGLTADLYRWMSEEAIRRGDKKDAKEYKLWYEQLRSAVNEKLWDDEKGWFYNLYPDGTTGITWTYHLFDLLEKNQVIDDYKAHRLISHLVDGEFMAPYGLYSMSKADELHWDLVDTDFGGGGQYEGIPLRISKNLFMRGYGLIGWEILKRYTKYTKHFPYFTHNPQSDKMAQDLSSMSLQISTGAGIEAIFSGIFGIIPHKDGSVTFSPFYHMDLGDSSISNFRFRGNVYNVVLKTDEYEVWKNGSLFATNKYGVKTIDNN